MLTFKACPRCHGDLYENAYGEIACIQCGHELHEREPQPATHRVERANLRRPKLVHAAARSRAA
jgi:uncharacterized Zn finger protein (UPF0148 family)